VDEQGRRSIVGGLLRAHALFVWRKGRYVCVNEHTICTSDSWGLFSSALVACMETKMRRRAHVKVNTICMLWIVEGILPAHALSVWGPQYVLMQYT
jgi:hypothetical protein